MTSSGLDFAQWLVTQSAALNLFASLLVAGSAVYLWRARQQAPLLFWMLQWLLMSVLYALRWAVPPLHPLVGVILVEGQTALLIGFGWSFYKGKDFRPAQCAIWLVIIFFALSLWDLALFGIAANKAGGSLWRYVWIGPSACVSLLTLVSFSALFLFRLGWPGRWLTLAGMLYAVLQGPVYIGLLVESPTPIDWLLPLAVGKLVLGATFHIYFSSPFSIDAPLQLLPTAAVPLPKARPAMLKLLKFFGSFVGLVASHYVATWLYELSK